MNTTRPAVWWLFTAAVLIATCPHETMAQSRVIELRWDELSPLVVGREVEISLPDGVELKGELVSVRSDSLAIDVTKTSNTDRYPKGQRSIPRSSVSTLGFRRARTIRWRVVGTSAGVVGGIFAGAGVGTGFCQYSCGAGAVWGGIAAGVGVGVLGNYLGRRADTQRTTIKIIPD